MNKQEEILTILQEECAEVIQAVSKIKRFGQENNEDDLKKEIADLICMIDLVFEFKVVDVTETEMKTRIIEKRNKLKKYSKIFEVIPETVDFLGRPLYNECTLTQKGD